MFIPAVRLPGEPPWRPDPDLDLVATGWILLVGATVLVLAGSGLLRRWPLPALILLLAGAVAAAMELNSTTIEIPQFLAVDVALCVIAATRPRRTSIVAGILAVGVLAVYASIRLLLGFPIGTSEQLVVALTAVIAWQIGNSSRQSRDHAERLSVQHAAQAVTVERLRISRELHDVVAHSIGIIALQAGAASRVIDTQPSAARTAMTAVETASRETLSELRRMLGGLRRADPGPVAAPLDPMPGLADLDRLAAATTAAGVRVDVRWGGQRRPLPTDIDLSAFRIIQESVTNVVRHSGTRSCQVFIDHRDEELSIEVVDNGHGRSGTTGTGYGIAGMRERVGLLHGDFSAAARPEGGFRVTARLPVPVTLR
ncbi:sensor histidine kinase [Plantactinospora sp. WMMB782]|uniref:sensor histidine kinase n=1 Tax=Plantactinospora sp. WMMB782 TaxID=3404121 RepID=UPI003B936300